MKTVSDKEIKPCKCGGRPRYRYSVPVHWIECSCKRCSERTRYYPDMEQPDNPKAIDLAIKEWNSM